MVKRLMCAVGFLVLLALAGCKLTEDLIEMPLTDDERLLLGHWQHVHGIGNVWNWEFSEEYRRAHSFSSNLIFGESSSWYHWAASSNEIVIYEADKLFRTEVTRYTYSFFDPDWLLIGTEEYDRQ